MVHPLVLNIKSLKLCDADVSCNKGASHISSSRPSMADPTSAMALFDWAHMIVSSRSFSLSDCNGSRFACLIPLADYANHAIEPNASFQLSSTPCVHHSKQCPSHVLCTKRPLSRGEEVLLNYGDSKCNLMLLSSYGFCTPGNLADRLLLGHLRAWGDHNSIADDITHVDQVMQQALFKLDPTFSQVFATGMTHTCVIVYTQF